VARLFGTDGIRGIANQDLTHELAASLGRAVVRGLAAPGGSPPSIVVGRDTRASGEFLEAALAAGICSAGGDAVLLGVSTTPAVAFLTADLGAAAGAVISASHNPAEYNGIKFFGPNGYKVPDETEEAIESLVAEDRADRPTGRDVGRVLHASNDLERYLSHLESVPGPSLDGMRVVVDCANGAAYRAAPEVLRRRGAEVIAIHDAPDGMNINEASGATAPEHMASTVVEVGADAGVAHDGDADRAVFADHLGRLIDGDQVLAACARDLRARGELDGDAIVTTVMANLGLRRAMEESGIRVIETRVGDRYVLEEMLRSGVMLGGEQSGHVIFLRHATTGDGLLTALQFLGLAAGSGRTVAELAQSMTKFPQVLRNVQVADRDALEDAGSIWDAVRASEASLGTTGRILVRASGTEPLVRVMVEAPTEEEASLHASRIAEAVSAALGPVGMGSPA
jgi:phosphoglucosamine mutase